MNHNTNKRHTLFDEGFKDFLDLIGGPDAARYPKLKSSIQTEIRSFYDKEFEKHDLDEFDTVEPEEQPFLIQANNTNILGELIKNRLPDENRMVVHIPELNQIDDGYGPNIRTMLRLKAVNDKKSSETNFPKQLTLQKESTSPRQAPVQPIPSLSSDIQLNTQGQTQKGMEVGTLTGPKSLVVNTAPTPIKVQTSPLKKFPSPTRRVPKDRIGPVVFIGNKPIYFTSPAFDQKTTAIPGPQAFPGTINQSQILQGFSDLATFPKIKVSGMNSPPQKPPTPVNGLFVDPDFANAKLNQLMSNSSQKPSTQKKPDFFDPKVPKVLIHKKLNGSEQFRPFLQLAKGIEEGQTPEGKQKYRAFKNSSVDYLKEFPEMELAFSLTPFSREDGGANWMDEKAHYSPQGPITINGENIFNRWDSQKPGVARRGEFKVLKSNRFDMSAIGTTSNKDTWFTVGGLPFVDFTRMVIQDSHSISSQKNSSHWSKDSLNHLYHQMIEVEQKSSTGGLTRGGTRRIFCLIDENGFLETVVMSDGDAKQQFLQLTQNKIFLNGKFKKMFFTDAGGSNDFRTNETFQTLKKLWSPDDIKNYQSWYEKENATSLKDESLISVPWLGPTQRMVPVVFGIFNTEVQP